MNFAATALGAGIAAAVVIAHLQGALTPASDAFTGATVIDARLDPMTTASIAPAASDTSRPAAIRLIDLRSGDIVHWLRTDGIVEELYVVVVLPGVRRPMAIGFRTDESFRSGTSKDFNLNH